MHHGHPGEGPGFPRLRTPRGFVHETEPTHGPGVHPELTGRARPPLAPPSPHERATPPRGRADPSLPTGTLVATLPPGTGMAPSVHPGNVATVATRPHRARLPVPSIRGSRACCRLASTSKCSGRRHAQATRIRSGNHGWTAGGRAPGGPAPTLVCGLHAVEASRTWRQTKGTGLDHGALGASCPSYYPGR